MDSRDIIAVSIFSFLDNLLPRPSLRQRQSSPPNVPPEPPPRSDVVAGGYPEEIFVLMSENEKNDFSCSVCYNILKDAHQCKNGHKFCYTCVYVWSTTNGSGAELCPMCRCEGLYARLDSINTQIGRKRVKCLKSDCNWRGQLSFYEKHIHKIYDEKELNAALKLPSVSRPTGKLIKPKHKDHVPITSIRTTNMSTSEYLRTFDYTTSDENTESSTARVLSSNRASGTDTNRVNPVPPTVPRSETPSVPRSSINSGARRLTRPSQSPVNRSRINSSGNVSSTQTTSNNPIPPPNRSRSNSTTTSDPPTQSNSSTAPPSLPGMMPRPPGLNRPRAVNPGVTTSNRPLVASRAIPTEATPTPPPPRPPPNSLTPISQSETPRLPSPLTAHRPLPPNPPENIASQTSQLDYRRLAPIRRPPARLTEGLREGREQLAVMLTLMTMELEGRRRAIERQMADNLDRQQRVSLSEIEEVRLLNHRLSAVANNLERIVGNSEPESPPVPTDSNSGGLFSSTTGETTLPAVTPRSQMVNNAAVSTPATRERFTLRFNGISGISGMEDSSSEEDC